MNEKVDKKVETLALVIACNGPLIIVGVFFFIKAFAELESANFFVPTATAAVSSQAFTCLTDAHTLCNAFSRPPDPSSSFYTAGSP